MDRETLIQAMGNPVISNEECDAFNQALARSGCTNVNRAAMFCAQVGHESIGLRYYSEIWEGAGSRQQQTYQGRMGNNNPGDGYRYRGSGPLQVTGKDNFRGLSEWAFDKGFCPTRTYFVDNPDELRSIHYGFLGAIWYWTEERPMNDYADRGDIRGASIAVNGGTTGLDDRIARWKNCLNLGARLLPEGGFLMGLPDNKQEQVWSGAAQLDKGSFVVRRAPNWLVKFLPSSFRDPGGVWVRDEIDAICTEVVTGTFTFSPNDTIDFEDGKGPIRLVDIDPSTPVNFVTLQRIIAAHLVQNATKGK